MFKKEVTLILTFIAAIMPLIMHPFSDDSYYLPKAIFLYFMYLILIFLLFKDRKNLAFNNKDKILGVYLALALISTLTSIKPTVSIFGSTIRYEGILMLFFYVLTYYSAKKYVEINRKAVNLILSAVIIISIYSIFQFYNIDPIPKDSYHASIIYNAIGTQGHRNFLSAYLTLFLPWIIGIYILKGNKKYLGIAVVLFSSLLCTLTRSGWIAFIIYAFLGLIYVIVNFKKEYLFRGLTILAVFVSVFFVLDFTSGEKISSRSDQLMYDARTAGSNILESGKIEDEGLGSARIYIWKVALKTIKENPLLGSGPDTFRYSIEKYYPEDGQDYIDVYGAIIDKAHNEFLQIASTIGIPALIVYLLFLVLVLKDNIKNMWKNEINFFISTTLIAYVIQSFFNISVINVAPLFWMGLGLAQNPKRIEDFLREEEGCFSSSSYYYVGKKSW